MPWLAICTSCGLRQARFDPDSRRVDAPSLQEDARESGLEPLRRANFERVLDRLESCGPPSEARLLEVGCGHGWFLDAAARRRFVAEGIEPDLEVARRAGRTGRTIRTGYFPACLEPGERWDVLVMNDVFEHLGDPGGALDACRDALRPGGILVLNLPTADGLLYRIAELLARAGSRGALERLWQKGFPSPHLFYYDDRTLAALAADHGFTRELRSPLPSIEARGLWHRVRMDLRVGLPAALLQCAALLALYPLLRWFAPSDITLHVYRRS